MQIDPDGLDGKGRYLLLTSALIPRPIAWLSTISPEGRGNLAPFSFFGGVATTPPLVAISILRRRGGKKDSCRNLEATGEGVIHVPTEDLAPQMVLSSGDFPHDVDEFDLIGLETAPGTRVAARRLLAAPLSMEVVVERLLHFGDAEADAKREAQAQGEAEAKAKREARAEESDHGLLAICRIVLFHVEDRLLDGGRVRPDLLRVIGRLAGTGYCRVSDIFHIPRPDTARELAAYLARLEDGTG
ncbi:MAG: flavin reductase family protein, partial [Candidatus Eisenbacteria bacterium]|nr:flavin reductase family protein [Candidatus Eisenbacteria bacterium]